eukprot:81243-Rhodomonas_salina.1
MCIRDSCRKGAREGETAGASGLGDMGRGVEGRTDHQEDGRRNASREVKCDGKGKKGKIIARK